jgi:TPR repeat protein
VTYRQIAFALWLASCCFLPARAHAQAFHPWTCDGVRRNPSAVLPQAQAGDPAAMALLSQLYFCDDRLTQSQRQSNSFQWALAAANKGNSPAMVVVAQFYVDGVVVARKDPQTAGEWYFRAANAGAGKTATDPLFWLYHNKQYVPQSKNAVECLDAYDKGSMAFSTHNYTVSLQQMKLSYQLGCKWAANAIGVHYEFGDGLPQPNAQTALQWYEVCAKTGDEDCIRRYNNLSAQQNATRAPARCPQGIATVNIPAGAAWTYTTHYWALAHFCSQYPSCPYHDGPLDNSVHYCTAKGTPY